LSVPAPTGKEIGKKEIAPPVFIPGTPTAASLKVDLDPTGTDNRPEFPTELDQIRAGDTIVVWKLDRLVRSTRDLLETMETIQQAGGKFRSLSEPWADTTTHAGKMIITIFAGIAEFERGLIREQCRTSDPPEGRSPADAYQRLTHLPPPP
jgi:hypothetical protein